MNAPQALKEWRASQELTQDKAAKLARVSAATWCDWENGNKVPRVDKAEDLESLTGRAVRVSDWAEYARTPTNERKPAAGGEHG